MNAVHLIITGGIGGIETLTKEISENSHQNNIFYFLFDGGVIAEQVAENHMVHIAHGSHTNFFGEAKKFTKFCKEQQADVILAHSGAPIIRFLCTYAKSAMKTPKFILYWHSNASIWFCSKSKIKNLLSKSIEKAALKKCDYAVAISESVKQSFVKLLGHEEKIKVVYNGMDTGKFSPAPRPKSNRFEIIYVGRVFPAKGVHLLIKALAFLPGTCNIHLNIVGKYAESYGNKLKASIEENNLQDKVSLCGAQTNVNIWLQKSNLFVHPAIINEGFGITLAEAMACGVPCVAFDEGAMREIIEDGKNGFIAEEQTAQALAIQIERMYTLWQQDNEAYETMCSYAHCSSQKFSIENTVKQLESLYQ